MNLTVEGKWNRHHRWTGNGDPYEGLAWEQERSCLGKDGKIALGKTHGIKGISGMSQKPSIIEITRNL